MAPTRDFKETIFARIERDPDFREALLDEGVQCLLSGNAETGRSVLGTIAEYLRGSAKSVPSD